MLRSGSADEREVRGTMERVARDLRRLSTAPEEDLLIIVKRALFAWLIADGDMHLKNMALLKIAEPGDRQFRTVRMAPLYDAVTTRVFPKLKHYRLALKLTARMITSAALTSRRWRRRLVCGPATRTPLWMRL